MKLVVTKMVELPMAFIYIYKYQTLTRKIKQASADV